MNVLRGLTRSVLVLSVFLLMGTHVTEARPTMTLDLGVAVGHRTDQLRWSISGNNVNILSELTWEDLNIVQVTLGGRLIVDYPNPNVSFYGRGSMGMGSIYSGDNQDSDYSGDNRTGEFSRSNNQADQGDVLDGSLGMGIRFKHTLTKAGATLSVAPLAGYSYHEQNLQMTEGFQTIPFLGPFPGLNSTYDTEWRGPWVGFDLFLNTGPAHTFLGTLEYHWFNYEARANWNLRSDLAHPLSFFHEANGTGLKGSLGLEERVLKNGVFIIKLEYLEWTTKPGTDYIFFNDGTRAVTPLNEVRWKSYAFTLQFRYAFR